MLLTFFNPSFYVKNFLGASLCAVAGFSALSIFLVIRIRTVKKQFNMSLEAFRLHDSLTNDAIDACVAILRDLVETAATSESACNWLMARHMHPLLLHPDNPESIFHNFSVMADCRFYGVITSLRESNAKLTDEDLLFCSLICFDLSPAAIGLLYGHTSDQSYYNRRYRVRKKIGISKDSHIRTFLNERIAELMPVNRFRD